MALLLHDNGWLPTDAGLEEGIALAYYGKYLLSLVNVNVSNTKEHRILRTMVCFLLDIWRRFHLNHKHLFRI